MAKRETSPKMSSLAARVLNWTDPFQPEVISKLIETVREVALDGQALEAIHNVFDPWIQAARSLAGTALAQDETPGQDAEPQAGTHAYDLVAAAEKQNIQTTETLIHMVAATVLAKLIADEGGGRSNISFSPADMDAMHRDYEIDAKHDGILTVVRIVPRTEKLATHAVHDIIGGQAVETEASLLAQDESTANAMPQAEPKAERPYWFFNSGGSGRLGPVTKEEAQALVHSSVDPTARVENRECNRAICPNSDQQGVCPTCSPD